MSQIITPPPVNLDFNIVNVKDCAKISPRPERIFISSDNFPSVVEFKLAKKFFSDVKILRQARIRGLPTERVFEIFMTNLPALQEVYKSLVDEDSKKTFCGYWLGCITNQMSEVVYANTPQYICPGFLPKAGDIVFDCGAYDGGTSVRFVNMGCKVYAFEMEKANYDKTLKVAEEKNFVVENFALGSHKHKVNYIPRGIASRIDSGGTATAQVITIDNYVGEKNLPRVDFIKMDVEGTELDILKGAAITISRFKPILALSAYHKLDDFWTLTKFIKSIRPDYEFALRQYATTPEDAPGWFPKSRLDYMESFDLEVNHPNYEECVLFAR